MNTSYNYADFVGLNLRNNGPHETRIGKEIKPKSKKRLAVKNSARLNDVPDKAKTPD